MKKLDNKSTYKSPHSSYILEVKYEVCDNNCSPLLLGIVTVSSGAKCLVMVVALL